MIKSSLCNYSDAYILYKRIITVSNMVFTTAAVNTNCAEVAIKKCAPFTNCLSKINNRQKGNAKDIDEKMTMFNLIEHSDNNSKISKSFWQYYRVEPSLSGNDVTHNFPGKFSYFLWI